MRAPLRALRYAVPVLAFFALWGCQEDPGGVAYGNRAPHVWLSSAPPSGAETGYKIHLYWGGWDPDGEIGYYEYCITDNVNGIFDPADTASTPGGGTTAGRNPWRRVWANDSVFVFSADELVDSTTADPVTRFQRSHTFLIRAVDREGLPSVEVAHRSFTAWTLSPSIYITSPRIRGEHAVPPVSTFQWHAVDYLQDLEKPQEPDSIRWILRSIEDGTYDETIEYIRAHPNSPDWYPWFDYKAPHDSGHFWTTPPTDLGKYVFAVQAKDEAGAVTPVFDDYYNVRRIRVETRTNGPQIDVSNEYIGTIRSTSSTPSVVIVDLPSGVPISFTFTASAEYYGATVSGYRYGWDVANLSDPDDWDIDITPFTDQRGYPEATTPARTFYYGTHTFDVEVYDYSSNVSRVEVKVNIVPFTMTSSVLLIDDFEPKQAGIYLTRGETPNDAQHDAFWESMLGDVVGFNIAVDQITVRNGVALPIARIAAYRSIIWDSMSGYDVNQYAIPKLYSVIRFRRKGSAGAAGKVEPNLLLLFLRAGGHLMLCGHQPLTMATGSARKYPVIFKYELLGDQDGNYVDQIESDNFVGDESFGYREACINALDLAYFKAATHRRSGMVYGCPVDLKRDNDLVNDGMRRGLPLDPRFPLIELRPEVGAAGLAYGEENKGYNAELYNPPYFSFCPHAEMIRNRPCFEPIYGNGCLNESSAIYNAPVAVWSSTYADVVPDIAGGVGARSVYVGFEPYYFKPNQVKQMMDVILFDEWKLARP